MRLEGSIGLALVAMLVLLAMACTGGDDDRSGWEQLPEPPIEARADPLVADLGGRVLVVGGWNFLCPAGASCIGPEEPPYADGAILDLATREWNRIADAPRGFVSGSSAVVGDDVYVIEQCEPGSRDCSTPRTLLRYRSATDTWDILPAPPSDDRYALMAHEGSLVAYTGADVGAGNDDFLLRAGEDRWAPIPDDPLPSVSARWMFSWDGDLWLFGTRPSTYPYSTLGARYDSDRGTWSTLPDHQGGEGTVWHVGDRFLVPPQLGTRDDRTRPVGGGSFDPRALEWLGLPAGPPFEEWPDFVGGMFDDAEAVFQERSGWTLDLRSDEWIDIPDRPGAQVPFSGAFDAVGNRLVVVGGELWDEEHPEGLLLGDVWMWTPPESA